jgi:transcriptional regulator with XRE-family HTH domain
MARRQRLVDRRDELGLSQADVAHTAGLTANSIRRYELGLSAPRTGDRRAYAKALGWTPQQLSVALAGEAAPVNGHAVPGWLGHLGSLEQAAGSICAYEAVGVHGLLQTADYAAAVERVGPEPANDAEIARRVKSRLARQAVLTREPEPLRLSVILDESVLHRRAGGPAIMATQFDHLIEMAERPNVDLRVLPLSAGMFAFGSLTLITQLGATAPWVAITEDLSGPHYFEADRQPDPYGRHVRLFDYLIDLSLDHAATLNAIVAAAKETRQ